MHFDDRLATVLRLPASAGGLARVQFRQLVDILGSAPDDAASETIEAGFQRLDQLRRTLPTPERARLLDQPIRNTRLIAYLAQDEPDVACAAIAAAQLDDAQWLALIPALPVRARGILRHRRDVSAPVAELLARLGVQDRGLPAGPVDPDPDSPIPETPRIRFKAPTGDLARDQDISDDVAGLLALEDSPPPPTSLSDWARARAAHHAQQFRDPAQKAQVVPAPGPAAAPVGNTDAGIGAIVRRIEEFRKAREASRPVEVTADSPRLPLGDAAPAPVRQARVIDFMTDPNGRIGWADGPWASSVVGLNLTSLHLSDNRDSLLAATIRRRLSVRAAIIDMAGAPAVTGIWQVDAVPQFAHGRFTGYAGRLRRPLAEPAAASAAPPGETADRLREVLHELRTPANAIQVAAEIIQQQLYGPAPHEYRALAAAIAGDCAHILAGFEELDRLVKLESGAQTLDEGECDLARVLAQTIVRLRAWTQPRGSGFAMAGDPSATSLPVRVARSEVERLVWRLLAALAGLTAPGESLYLTWTAQGPVTRLEIALPALLAERDPAALFDAVPGERGQSLATGMFGVGFTLRLAAAEASAAGGGLQRIANAIVLSLPALTDRDAPHSTQVTRSN
ncbi:HAMP domain-containing histidine kinase [Novosphingobium sp. Leaf2]|uniref:HAMP domain-containing histidine kinase n=1 Tax=Novosphingobium sp. Leaf2 TaxID=1735670 RepID=UPI000700CC67|nr:HAMP domain-containing histidine kinase [Novosphingobium sp. Leaf2]KQM19394.1 histidine kinase [Novosphingobium sp. Leaf2]